ncbi:predicted protein [Sclerotinia sclerotiorum 1980 UF-70]|uniref:N-acetyltransferase domain-containing protein n=2 Tax=Sclerotinia sclerotiorum (strain ATCC 18683 / 1980 / Ss-1) TaxID=665079 RepID=A7F3Y2_SCLS1|nr:predicted protein [Sclerotinia sclerotiorum 1980 UF-70]APA14231.1 hypothetical protein sscle_12g090010 [Sclerotinia sclerotiorum 1980 UF-70]EDN97453.1 predicted protein [Sclerotinia sclerotiorum 1980 UF-70]
MSPTLKTVATFEEFSLVVDCLWESNIDPFNPFLSILVRIKEPTAEGVAAAVQEMKERLWKCHKADKDSVWIYIVGGDEHTEASGKVLAGAEWLFHEVNPFGEKKDDEKQKNKDDEIENGETENGETENGETENGETENGETENGETENGETENGETENGETENGETENGETENGETENGETENGETENGEKGGEEKDDSVGSWWPEGEARDFTKMIFSQIFGFRARRMARPHTQLSAMFTHPEHRCHGYGSLLMEYGMRRTSEMNVEALVEATAEGLPLYEKFGFRTIEKITIDTTRRDRKPGFLWLKMANEVKGKTTWWMWKPKPSDGEVYTPGMELPWERK